jgi:hypothetical protein
MLINLDYTVDLEIPRKLPSTLKPFLLLHSHQKTTQENRKIHHAKNIFIVNLCKTKPFLENIKKQPKIKLIC